MAERIRNFFRFNILPVLPYLRKKNRGTAVNLCILILFLFAMNTAQIVHEASKIIEADAAQGEEVHLICRNTTGWSSVTERILCSTPERFCLIDSVYAKRRSCLCPQIIRSTTAAQTVL